MRDRILKHGLDWAVESAGLEAYHVGEAPHRFSQKICLTHGINISGLRARKFKQRDFEHFDKIYAMATDVYYEIKRVGGRSVDLGKVELFLNEAGTTGESVPDPYYGGEEGYKVVYDLIAATCDKIIEKYGT